MRVGLNLVIAVTASILATAIPAMGGALRVTDLRCEYTTNPLGVDSPAPRLLWKVESSERGQHQTAYQVLAASSMQLLDRDEGDLWDSGRVDSDETTQIPYTGEPLKSSQQVFWKVRSWDKQGVTSAWSRPANWTMGVLNQADWRADWIGAPEGLKPAVQTLVLRREFDVKPRLCRALACVCGLGCYELSIDGRKVGDALFPPGWTKYDKTCLYDTYDITALLHKGRNAVGLLLGNGMYNVVGGRYVKFKGSFGPLKAIAQLRLEYGDGAIEFVGTDAQWMAAPGPITFSCVYGGEDYDARLEPDGWKQPGFDDSKWTGALLMKGPGGRLKGLSSSGPPIRTFDILKSIKVSKLGSGSGESSSPLPGAASNSAQRPFLSGVGTARPQYLEVQELGTRRPHPEDVSLMQPRPFPQPSPSGRGNAERQLSSLPTVSTPPTNGPEPSITVYDLGQNAALMPRIKVRGPAGARVRITPAELLAKDGAVDRGSCAGGKPGYWEYTLAGKGKETWFPKFFYQGCRYLQVECTPPPGETSNPPLVESVEGVVVHADSPPVGDFQCSNDLFNRIRRLVRWAQISNMMSVMTDCPHREKLGWLEEDHLNGPALRYEFDLARLTGKMMNDMADSQAQDGLVPDIAPEYVRFSGGFRDSPEWGSACILVPWQQYEFTGDIDLLRAYYDPMRRYAAYLGGRAANDIVSHGLGDWYDIGPKAPGVAQLTPVPLTATAFYYCDVSILSRMAALLDQPQEATNYDALAARIRSAFNEKFFTPSNSGYATGSQCANALALVMGLAEPANRPALVEALVKDVRSRGNALTAGDVGYRYLLRALAQAGRSDVIFDINNQSDKPGYGYQLKQGATSLTEAWNARRSSSQNHFMLGQITEWLYHDLAGIGGDPAGPGFKKIIINPAPVGDITWVKARYDSIHGEIVSNWKRDGSRFTLEVTLPANTTATIFVPARSARDVTVDRAAAESVPGVRFLRQQADRAVYDVVSGHYVFRSAF
jgi:hypothetical protein